MNSFWSSICGGIVVAIVSCLGSIIANKRSKKLERKNYVSKVRFDAEFAIYRELLNATDELVRSMAALYAINNGAAQSVDEVIPLCSKACTKHSKYARVLAKNSAFIPEKVFDKFESIKLMSQQQLKWILSTEKSFIEKVYYEQLPQQVAETKKLIVEYKNLQNNLRNHLSSLDVM